MIEMYVIHWVSKVNGRAGYGTRKLAKRDAESLANELNEEYPEIQHEAVSASSVPQPVELEPDTESALEARQPVPVG